MTGSINLKELRLEESGDSSRLLFDYSLNGKDDQIYFEVDKKYGSYLCHENADAFVMLFLPGAMKRGLDIVSSVPVSEDLLYNLRLYLIPSIARYNPELYCTAVKAPAAPMCGESAPGIGISFSGGVDSFYALLKHINSGLMKDRPVYFFTNDVSGLGRFNREQKEHNFRIMKAIADELGFPQVVAWSNAFQKVNPLEHHARAHNFTSSFAIFCLQKLWGIHLYSSGGYRLNMANIDCTFKVVPGKFRDENIFHQFMSTKALKVYCAGTEATRVDKLRYIADFQIVQKHLTVCLDNPVHCSVCDKCMMTILGLDVVGKLDKFSGLFDVNYYRKNRPRYLQYMYKRAVRAKDPFFVELYDCLSGTLPESEHDYYMKVARGWMPPHVWTRPYPLRYKGKIRRLILGGFDMELYWRFKRKPKGIMKNKGYNLKKLLMAAHKAGRVTE